MSNVMLGRDMIVLLCEITGVNNVSGIRSISIKAAINDVAVMTIERIASDDGAATYEADSKTGNAESYTVTVTRIKADTDE